MSTCTVAGQPAGIEPQVENNGIPGSKNPVVPLRRCRVPGEAGTKLVPAEACERCTLRSAGFLCEAFSSAALCAFQTIRRVCVFPKGKVLFAQDQRPRGVFMLCQGQVKLSMFSSQGRGVIVRIIEPGEIIGVAATLAGKPHEFTAETISECQVNFVERDQFREFVRAHHDVCLQVVGQLAMKYSLMLKALRPLVSRSVATRLAKLLLDWSSGEAAPGAAARVVSPSLTHESIAQLVGSSRETVTRLLSIMKQLRILQVTGPQIAIRDKAALKVLGHVD